MKRYLTHAVQVTLYHLDDVDLYPITDAEWERDWTNADHNMNIGSEQRRDLARLVRRVRRDWADVLRSEVRKNLKRMQKNPRRWYLTVRQTQRKQPQTIVRQGRPAKSHRDCYYCGCGYSDLVCGRCKENGIDGRTIPGTAATKSTIYVIWK